ncbi:hypothetical protein [Caenimonas koreensis]|uniref:Uncharacterized protein n=1 Tax=Caenimonas koreensis DSM 17982 TaxID=1121255 RepID=A0A844BC84_9BURK|nr:hypothetical protein [Caenimonas koreensis]MRD49176.1 hypothetical protein [Caenimonas koreensis DSM 17982]
MQVKTSFCTISFAILSLVTAQGALAQAAKSPKVVTKDELRVCMDSESSLAARRKEIEARKAANVAEIAAIKTANVQMAEEQKDIDESNDRKVREFKRKVTAHNDRVKAANAAQEAFVKDLEAFNKSLVAYNDSCGGISYSREDKEEILKEREAAAKK